MMDTQYTVLDYGEEVKVNSKWGSPCDIITVASYSRHQPSFLQTHIQKVFSMGVQLFFIFSFFFS